MEFAAPSHHAAWRRATGALLAVPMLLTAIPAFAQPNAHMAYDQLCGPGGKAAPATCAALRKDLENGASAARPTIDVEVYKAALAHHVKLIAQGQPDYAHMTVAQAGRIPAKLEFLKNVFSGFGAGDFTFQRLEDGFAIFTARHPVGLIEWRIKLDPDGRMDALGWSDSRRRNADRGDQTREKFLTYRAPFVDPITVGQTIDAVFENSDGNQIAAIWREDCYLIQAAPGQDLKLSVYTEGFEVFARVMRKCGGDSTPYLWGTRSNQPFGVGIHTDGQPMYVWVVGRKGEAEYHVALAAMSAQEAAELRRQEQQTRLAEQEQKAERSAAFGQLLATGIAAYGVAATGGDLSAVPLSGNPLEILNGANAEVSRQQHISQDRFEATIAAAQPQATGARQTPQPGDSLSVASPTSIPPSGGSAAQGKTMYGWCYASQTSAGNSPIYQSQVGHIDNWLNGGTTSAPSESWIHRMETEFAGRIGAHNSLICYENASPSGFDYNRTTNAQTSSRIIDVPWAPH